MLNSTRGFVWVGALGALFIFALMFFLPGALRSTYVAPPTELVAEESVRAPGFVARHVEVPDPLKAIYMTACVAATPSWREDLKRLIETTELNAVVIDIKDYTGSVSFPNTLLEPNIGKGCVVPDMKEFVDALHASNIYVIGRISVFQDSAYTALYPELAVKSKATGETWKDHKGLSFVDVGAKPYWDYIIALSKLSYEIGFDELNYDYVRYPSDGNMQDTHFTWMVGTTTKAETLRGFFSYLYDNMKGSGAKLSVDLFGMTTTVANDMNIGQLLENALPYFDYISPMVYPSHYPKNWSGFANPAEYPYEVIKISMSSGIAREQAWNISNGRATTTPSKLRPWLQDFNLGATYDASKVRAQMQAAYDIGLNSWMLWNAGNKYTVSALLPE